MFDVERAASKGEEKMPPACGECRGRPWVTVEIDNRAYSRRCTCAKGRYLAAKDAERKRAGAA